MKVNLSTIKEEITFIYFFPILFSNSTSKMFVQPSAPQMGGGGQGMMSQMPNMDLPTSTVEISV